MTGDWAICDNDELQDNRHAEWIILTMPGTYGENYASFLHMHKVKRENGISGIDGARSELMDHWQVLDNVGYDNNSTYNYVYYLIHAANLACAGCGTGVPAGIEMIARMRE